MTASRRFLLPALCLAAALAAAAAQEKGDSDKEVAALLTKLGDDDYDVRKAAMDALRKMGEPAVPALRKAADAHPDPEVRLRAVVLTAEIAKAAYGLIRDFVGHEDKIRTIAVTKDGKYALTGSEDQTVRMWDLATGKQVKKYVGHTKFVWSVAFSPDEKQFVSSGSFDKSAIIWDTESTKEVAKLEGHADRVYGCDWSPDGKTVLTGGAGTDTTLKLWDAKTAKLMKTLEGAKGWCWRLHYSPDSTKAASTGMTDKSLYIWDLSTGKILLHVPDAHEEFVVGVRFTPDGKHVLTAGRDLTCKLWEVATGKLVRTYTGMADKLECIAFSPDGKRFLVGEYQLVHVFDTESGKIIHRFDEHKGKVLAVAFTPDGRKALSAGEEDKTMKMWGVPR